MIHLCGTRSFKTRRWDWVSCVPSRTTYGGKYPHVTIIDAIIATYLYTYWVVLASYRHSRWYLFFSSQLDSCINICDISPWYNRIISLQNRQVQAAIKKAGEDTNSPRVPAHSAGSLGHSLLIGNPNLSPVNQCRHMRTIYFHGECPLTCLFAIGYINLYLGQCWLPSPISCGIV